MDGTLCRYGWDASEIRIETFCFQTITALMFTSKMTFTSEITCRGPCAVVFNVFKMAAIFLFFYFS